MSKKIGIMGGTFNPIHNAHIMMAQAAYEQYDLDEVWFMPSKNPPHKKQKNIAEDAHRKRMIQLALDGIPYFHLSELELRREGTTYTSDTMRQIHNEHPEMEIFFILGGDSLIELKKWHKPKSILKRCHILAAPRGDCSSDTLSIICEKTGKDLGGKISPLDMPCVSISSRLLRKLLRNGAEIRGYCPEKVDSYIHLHGLYGCGKRKFAVKRVTPELYLALESCLRPKRFQHTLGVAHTAASLASRYGEDAVRAELAGMLHDCAKYYTGEEMIALCRKKQISLTQTELENTALIHGKLGEWMARKRYGVQDEEILSAIRCHTTGRPGMSKLEKILFVADYIEPCRSMETAPHPLEEVRKKCFQDLDEGMLMVLENTRSYLSRTGKVFDPITDDTWNYYKNKEKEV